MRILVFGGSGKIGSAVAWDLVRDSDVKQVGLIGRSLDSLERTRKKLSDGKVVLHAVDVGSRESVVETMRKYDAAAVALPDRRTSYKIFEAAIESGVPIVDMLEEFHRAPDEYETEGLELPSGMSLRQYGEWLHESALKKDVTLLDGMGFAPGLSNLTTGEGIRKMDKAIAATARVGGIPEKRAAQAHPLRYMITWAFDHVLREYMIRLHVRKSGKLVEVDAGSERESFVFNQLGKNEPLECAITPGMPSFNMTRPGLEDFSEKTVRWPGHWDGVQTLKECGLLDLDPVPFQGMKVVPREFLLSRIVPKLRPAPGDRDVCVMYNTVKGIRNGSPIVIEYWMWDEGDYANGITSMMRVTGYPVALGARLLAKGAIKQKGIVAPEDAIFGDTYAAFMEDLEKRGIVIKETVTRG